MHGAINKSILFYMLSKFVPHPFLVKVLIQVICLIHLDVTSNKENKVKIGKMIEKLQSNSFQ